MNSNIVSSPQPISVRGGRGCRNAGGRSGSAEGRWRPEWRRSCWELQENPWRTVERRKRARTCGRGTQPRTHSSLETPFNPCQGIWERVWAGLCCVTAQNLSPAQQHKTLNRRILPLFVFILPLDLPFFTFLYLRLLCLLTYTFSLFSVWFNKAQQTANNTPIPALINFNFDLFTYL